MRRVRLWLDMPLSRGFELAIPTAVRQPRKQSGQPRREGKEMECRRGISAARSASAIYGFGPNGLKPPMMNR
jgi:hypothetical protein